MDNRTIKRVLTIAAVVVIAIIVIRVLTFTVRLLFPLAVVALIIFGVYWFIKKRR